jgi:hypothetical protein
LDDEVKRVTVNPLEENLRKWKELCNFVKNLDDEEVEMFIEIAKAKTILGDEKEFRDFVYKIKSD